MRLILFFLLITTFAISQEKREILSFTTSKINDSLSGSISLKTLIKIFGKPDKIEDYNSECGLTAEQEKAKSLKIYYYDKTKFMVYNNVADLLEMDFTTTKFTYKTDKIKLSGKTTFKDIQKFYPPASVSVPFAG